MMTRHLVLLWFGWAAVAQAQIQLDGTLGRPAPALAGPNFQIHADYGRQVGRNLFHSFRHFNLATGESASFSGPATVRNVLARVTGGSVSSIDGLIQSTIPGANLFLLNPAGIVFGPNASLDVSGAFTATTADYIRFADGGRFSANPAERPVLTSADPRAFGFLPATPADVTLNDTQLAAAPYSRLVVVAGNVQLNGTATLSAPDGVVEQFAVGTAPEPREYALPSQELRPPPVIIPGSVQVDGSLGPASTLSGPVYEIDAASGRLAGPNLFHSFLDFQINSGEAAIFTGPPAVQNILVRVTGTQPSRIDGAVIAEIAGANLFFMNPNGVTLSSGAGMSLDGSLLVTTADHLRFRDGVVFPARPDGAAVLSSEPVTGLGFRPSEFVARGANGPIRLHHPDFDGVVVAPEFWMSPGKTLALIGGGIDVDRRTTLAPGGAVALLALNSPGELDLDLYNPATEFNTRTFTDHAALNLRNETTINVNGARAGLVTLRGRDILLDNGVRIEAQSDSVDSGLAVDVLATRLLTLDNFSAITALVFGSARGGDIRIEAPRMTLDNYSSLRTDTYFGSTGDGGNLLLRAHQLTIARLGSIGASVGGDGRGGEIRVEAHDAIELGIDGSGGEISAISFGGPIGRIDVRAGRLLVDANARISTESESRFAGGAIAIRAGLLRVAGGQISATSNNEGDGGSITIAADRTELIGREDGAFAGIQSMTGNLFSSSRGGSIELRRGDSGRGELVMRDLARISTSSFSLGAAGDILVDLDAIALHRGAGINSSSEFIGHAGSAILRSAGSIHLTGGSSLAVTAQQSRAGRLQLTAARDLRLDGVQLSATSLLDGGSIELKAGNLILLEGSQISASAGFDGGNILLDPPLIVLRNSSVTANSAAANAGLITIVAGGFLRSGSTVQATTPNKTAFQGQIEVTAPDSDLSGELVPLAGVFLHADSRLLENCAAVSLGTGSSFITHGRGGLSPNP